MQLPVTFFPLSGIKKETTNKPKTKQKSPQKQNLVVSPLHPDRVKKSNVYLTAERSIYSHSFIKFSGVVYVF